MDDIILGISAGCFFGFFAIHLALLRFLSQSSITKASQVLFIGFLIVDLYLSYSYGIKGILLTEFLLSLFCCVYLLRVFGIFEPSIRFKLVDIIGIQKGATLEEILSEINSKTILDARVKRLIEHNELITNEQLYTLNKKNNLYRFFNFINHRINCLIDRKK